jgi:beta-N-acetylhexosaminidase
MDLGVGGVLLTKTNVTGSQQVSDLVTGLRARADDEIVIATDEEPGRVSSFGALFGRSSSARTLAGRGAPTAVREAAEVLATDLAELGVDVVLAPVADLDDGPSDGVIGDRSFSADPYTATAFVRAHADGLLAGGVLPAVKHFPGHGRTRVDSHVRLDVVDADLEELTATDLQPFADQIDRGTPIVMLGHVAYTALDEDLPASLAPAAYDLLRDLGFDGVAMTDSLGMGAINQRWDFPEAAVMAVEAGADALLATDGTHARRMRDALVAAVRDGSLPESRLDEAAGRMAELTGNAGEQAGCGSR